MQSNLALSLKLRRKLGETADSSNFAPINIDALAREFNTSNTRVLRAARDLERKTKEIRRHYDTNGKLFAARLLPQFFVRFDWTVKPKEAFIRKESTAVNNNDNMESVMNSTRNPFENNVRSNAYVRPMLDSMSDHNSKKPFPSPDMSLRGDTNTAGATFTGANNTIKAPVDVTVSDMLPIISQYASVLSTNLSLLKEPPQIDPAAQTLVREALRAHEALKIACSLLSPEHRSRVFAVLRGI
ncbi:MAG: hypothetical protein EBR94_01055 [Bacteroidetes bacterium]|nr:hypothetical protein [Bacteroidota bacterium]